MSAWFAFKKEGLEAIRDRRSILMALVIPVLMPLMTFALVSFLIRMESTAHYDVAVVGLENAPGIEMWLESDRITLTKLENEAPRDALARYDAVVVIDDDFGEQFEFGAPAKLSLWYDSSQQTSGRAIRLVNERLQRAKGLVIQQRLTARGVSTRAIQVIDVTNRDVAKPGSRAAIVLGSMPGMIIFAAFACALATAIDTTSGERERLSIEPLLVQPVSPWLIVASKWFVVTLFGWVGATLTAILLHVVMSMLPLHELGMSWQASPIDLLGVAVGLIPVAVMAAAVMIVVALSAKTFKEAQTLLGVLQVLPLLLLIAIDISQTQLEGPALLAPLISQQALIKSLLTASQPFSIWMVGGMLVTLLCGLLFAAIAVRLLANPHRLLNQEG